MVLFGALRGLVVGLVLLLLERHLAVYGPEVVVDGLLPHPILEQLLLGDARVDRGAVGSVDELDLGLAFDNRLEMNRYSKRRPGKV